MYSQKTSDFLNIKAFSEQVNCEQSIIKTMIGNGMIPKAKIKKVSGNVMIHKNCVYDVSKYLQSMGGNNFTATVNLINAGFDKAKSDIDRDLAIQKNELLTKINGLEELLQEIMEKTDQCARGENLVPYGKGQKTVKNIAEDVRKHNLLMISHGERLDRCEGTLGGFGDDYAEKRVLVTDDGRRVSAVPANEADSYVANAHEDGDHASEHQAVKAVDTVESDSQVSGFNAKDLAEIYAVDPAIAARMFQMERENAYLRGYHASMTQTLAPESTLEKASKKRGKNKYTGRMFFPDGKKDEFKTLYELNEKTVRMAIDRYGEELVKNVVLDKNNKFFHNRKQNIFTGNRDEMEGRRAHEVVPGLWMIANYDHKRGDLIRSQFTKVFSEVCPEVVYD